MKKQLWLVLITVLCVSFIYMGCDPKTIKITGQLSMVSPPAAPESALRVSGADRTDEGAAEGYQVMMINLSDGGVAMAETGVDGAFEVEVGAKETYAMRFLNQEFRSQGGLAVDVEDDRIIVGLDTPAENLDLGEILLDMETGVAVSTGNGVVGVPEMAGANAMANDAYGCAADGGEPEGDFVLGINTDGNDPIYSEEEDKDGDCVPNIGDADDDNDKTLDDQDGGDALVSCPGIQHVTLFMNNKIEHSLTGADPTGGFIVITIHVQPEPGKTIQSVQISGPSYLSSLEYTDSSFYDAPVAPGTPWDATLPSCMGGSQVCGFFRSNGSIDLADAMAAGDTFVFTTEFTDSTSTTCPRMINSVLTYTPYNLRIGDDDALVAALGPLSGFDFHAPDLDGDGRFKMAFDIPAGTQLGFDYRFDLAPLNAGCNADGQSMSLPAMSTVDPTFTGDTRTDRSLGQTDVEVIIDVTNTGDPNDPDGGWRASPSDAWQFDITMQDNMGDNAAATGVRVKTPSSLCN